MFKRSLASLTAVAVASGAVVAPANAVTVKVNHDMSCTFDLNPEEAKFTGLEQKLTYNKEGAAHLKATLVEKQLSALAAAITKIETELAKPILDENKKKSLMSELEEKRKRFAANHSFKEALEKCTADKDLGSKKPGDSDQSGGSKKPGDSDQSGGSKKPGDSDQSGGSKKPGDSDQSGGSKKPDGERARPSTNGAVIGVIVAVLGILAAALPFIKSMLPARLRALLP